MTAHEFDTRVASLTIAPGLGSLVCLQYTTPVCRDCDMANWCCDAVAGDIGIIVAISKRFDSQVLCCVAFSSTRIGWCLIDDNEVL